MNTVKVRNIVIGEGMPKICIPITGADRNSVLREAAVLSSLPADMAEWRVDWYGDVLDFDRMTDTLRELRGILGDMPLLLTFRTAAEGGQRDADERTYADINIRAAQTGLVDMIDVELFKGEATVRRIITAAHAAGVKVMASSHDFDRTPSGDEIINRLRRMQDLGADITKIAVMPQSSRDVLTLLGAAEEMAGKYADRPFVAISMSGPGVISRLSGEIFGSAITFGAASKASAPGQIEAGELRKILVKLHDSL